MLDMRQPDQKLKLHVQISFDDTLRHKHILSYSIVHTIGS